jgi:hypothetical protein
LDRTIRLARDDLCHEPNKALRLHVGRGANGIDGVVLRRPQRGEHSSPVEEST